MSAAEVPVAAAVAVAAPVAVPVEQPQPEPPPGPRALSAGRSLGLFSKYGIVTTHRVDTIQAATVSCPLCRLPAPPPSSVLH